MTHIVVFMLGIVAGMVLFDRVINDHQLTTAYAVCSSNQDVKNITAGYRTVVHCTNGAIFILKEK